MQGKDGDIFMNRITNQEIRELKKIIRHLRMHILELRSENMELRHQLEESRAREGKGCLENLIEGITNVISQLDFSELLENQNVIDIPDDYLDEDGDE